LMTLCQNLFLIGEFNREKFIYYRRLKSSKVMLIDSYSCSCPMLVMLLCTCCKPANGLIFMVLCHFVCVRAAFAFVFVNTSEKANNAKVIAYYVLYYTVSLRLTVLPASTLRKIVVTTASSVYDCFWSLPLIVED